MDLDLFEPHHHQLAAEIRAFAQAHLAPLADKDDLESCRQMAKLMAEHGVLRHAGPTTGRLDGRSLVATREQLAWFTGAADSIFAVQGLGSYLIHLGGTEAQRARYLPKAASGEQIFAFALTEPEAGSDAGNIQTWARRDGDHYVLDGGKRFISNAGLADVYTVFARTAEGRKGVSAFVVEAGTPGFTVKPQMELLAGHPIAELEFRECRIQASARLGDEGAGLKLAYGTLDVFRTSVGAAATGMAQRALD